MLFIMTPTSLNQEISKTSIIALQHERWTPVARSQSRRTWMQGNSRIRWGYEASAVGREGHSTDLFSVALQREEACACRWFPELDGLIP